MMNNPYEPTRYDSTKQREKLEFWSHDADLGPSRNGRKYKYIRDLYNYKESRTKVFLFLDTEEDQQRAVKTVPATTSENKEAFKDLENEYNNMYKLTYVNSMGKWTTHDGIVCVRDWVEDEFRGYLVMDYAEGVTLRDYLKSNREVDQNVTRKVITRLAEALDFMHKNNIIHCDVKPENIMVDIKKTIVNSVKLIDFGLSKQTGEPRNEMKDDPNYEEGSREYKSPEQWVKNYGKPSFKSDQYSLAVVAYEMLNGKTPFDKYASKRDEDFIKEVVLNEEERPEFIRSLSMQMKDALQKALAKNPEKRFESCMAFVNEMEWVRVDSQPINLTLSKDMLDIFNLYRTMLGVSAKYHKDHKNTEWANALASAQRKLHTLLKMRMTSNPIVALLDLTTHKPENVSILSALFEMKMAKSESYVPVEYHYGTQYKVDISFTNSMKVVTNTFEFFKDLQAFVASRETVNARALSIWLPSVFLKDGLVIKNITTSGIQKLLEDNKNGNEDIKNIIENIDKDKCLSQADYVFLIVPFKRRKQPKLKDFCVEFFSKYCGDIIVDYSDELSSDDKLKFQQWIGETLRDTSWYFVDTQAALERNETGSMGMLDRSSIVALRQGIKGLSYNDRALEQFFEGIKRYHNSDGCEDIFSKFYCLELKLRLENQLKIQTSSSIIRLMIDSILAPKEESL